MSKYRPNTLVGDLLSSFLDEYADYISPYMMEKLEDVADEAEDLEKDNRDEIAELRTKVSEYKDKISDLESEHQKEIDGLNTQIDELERENYELVNMEGY